MISGNVNKISDELEPTMPLEGIILRTVRQARPSGTVVLVVERQITRERLQSWATKRNAFTRISQLFQNFTFLRYLFSQFLHENDTCLEALNHWSTGWMSCRERESLSKVTRLWREVIEYRAIFYLFSTTVWTKSSREVGLLKWWKRRNWKISSLH